MNTWVANNLVRVANYASAPVGNFNQGQYQSGGFLTSLGVLFDPPTVTCTIKDPSGNVTTPAPVKDGVGLYHVDVDTTGKPGIWTYAWGPQPYASNQFTVTPAPL